MFMKTRAIFLATAVIALSSCANAGTRQSETSGSDFDSVAASELADEETGITVPSIEVVKDTACIVQFLFDYGINRLKASSDGKPVIFTVDSLGLENPEGVKHVVKSVSYYSQLRKGDKYYDPATNTQKILKEDTEVMSEESLPYTETYDFDANGRLIKFKYECFEDDEQVVTFDYRPDGSFSYKVELKESDAFPNTKVYGRWNGKVWEEEILGWDYSKEQYKPSVSYAMEKQIVHPGFFTVEPVKGGKTEAILYRQSDGSFISNLTPGEKIPSDWLNGSDKGNRITRENKDSHGNSLKVKEYDSHNSAPETKYKITYW